MCSTVGAADVSIDGMSSSFGMGTGKRIQQIRRISRNPDRDQRRVGEGL
jgi:hypothetical protein